MKNAIIIGGSGMIGKEVLRHCIECKEIKQVISIVRKPSGMQHSKLQEIIHLDFLNFDNITEVLAEVDIVYYCLGAYTGAVDDALFKQITVDYTVAFAGALALVNKEISFCFLSGDGADLSEKSRLSFARYKGMAENYLMQQGFAHFHTFRPAYIYPVVKRKEPNLMYRMMRILYPLVKLLGDKYSISSSELAWAFFITGLQGADKLILENKDIRFIAASKSLP